jgi:diguanylate cyclase (GGDEF)-like protein
MNNIFHMIVDKFHSLSGESNLRVLSESQVLIQEARTFAYNGQNSESFHNKFIFFIERFINSTRIISDVYFHLRDNSNTWHRVSDNGTFEIPVTNKLMQFTELNEFFIINEDFKALDNVAGLKPGLRKQAALFQMMDYCDYLIVFNKKTIRTNKLIRFLESLVLQLKELKKESIQHFKYRELVDSLEKKLVTKEKNLVATERNLKRRVYEIHNLLEISNELYAILNLRQLINSALLIIVGQVGCQKAFAFLYDSNHRKYSKRFTKGLDQVELSELEIAVDHPLVAYFEKNHKPVLVESIGEEEALTGVCKSMADHQIELIAPIVYGDRVQGFVGCGTLLSEQKFSKNEMDIFNILINIISISVSNAQTYEDVKNLSLTDAMTNLNNYRYFEERLKEELNRARRNETTVSLIMLDIDHFKNYNDTLGHQAGDEALRNLGWILKNTVREEDIVNRYGGEEFCIILPGIEKEVIKILGERIRQKVEEYPFYKENVQPGGRLTVSLGGSCFPSDADNFEELVYKADQALYKSKNSGRNRLTVFTADM